MTCAWWCWFIIIQVPLQIQCKFCVLFTMKKNAQFGTPPTFRFSGFIDLIREYYIIHSNSFHFLI